MKRLPATEAAMIRGMASAFEPERLEPGVGITLGRLRRRVGDLVSVDRGGNTYMATVTRVGARGAVYATFRYDNGKERTVRV